MQNQLDEDSSINIPKSLNNFSDNGSRKAAGYYEKNNYINPSDSVSMVSSKLNNEEDGGMYINKYHYYIQININQYSII